MLSQFQASYQRVEQSLQRLTDSIAAYNPSVSAADELVAADEAVNRDLEQLIVHQTNHQRIQELRQTAESLDDTLKNTIKLLADTRKEIQAIPSSSTPSEERREVNINELLSYAKFISKTTVPPTFRKKTSPAQPTIKREASDAQITNGIATPPPGTLDPSQIQNEETNNIGIKSIDPTTKRFLDPLKDLPFEPWPSHEVIQRGALAEIQRMIESGRDPGSVLTEEEQEEVDRGKSEEEEREKVRLEEMERRRMSLFDQTSGRRRETAVGEVFDPDNL